MTPTELRALAGALSGERIAGMLDAEEAQVCEDAAGYLRAQADEKPMAWITEESAQRLLGGGNDSRGTVPVHYAKSSVSKIALYAHPVPAAPQAEPSNNCRGVPRRGCNYLSQCGSVCNKCGHIHDPVADAVTALAEPKREALTDERIAKGEYVLATKWGDGDPGDHWGVGFYDRFENGRHYVVDSAGKQFRGNGFRRVGRITVDVGRWLLSAANALEASPPGTVNLWKMLTERAHGIGGSDEC